MNTCSQGKSVKGYVHVYTGNGKGKTTAAMGLTLRAVASGMRVFIGQFMKGRVSGELEVLSNRFPEVRAEQFGSAAFIMDKPTLEDIERARGGLLRIMTVMLGEEFGLIIADEAATACSMGLLPVENVLELIRRKPDSVELVITGRNADARIIEQADLVTEMVAVKHYFDKGIQARHGIDI